VGVDRIGANIPSLFFKIWYSSFSFFESYYFDCSQSHVCYVIFQGLLEGVSHSFTKNFHFIDSVKAYLSYALLRASVSQSPVIFQVLLNNIISLCECIYMQILISILFLGSMQLEYSWCCYCGSGRVSKYAYYSADLAEASQQENNVNLMSHLFFYYFVSRGK